MHVSLGRLPADPTRPKLRLTGNPTPPGVCDWWSHVPNLGMLLNDRIGDCTIAGAGHIIECASLYGIGTETVVTDDQVLTGYEAVAGYDPRQEQPDGSNPTDRGATLQEALDYWRKVGVGGHKLIAAALVDHTHLDMVRRCIAEFGAVYAGMNFPASAMDQFNAGQPWTVQRSKLDGGHCVPLVGYDSSTFTCITWGRAQQMDLAFFARYFDETWVPISQDWVSRGINPAGLNLTQLNADYQALTGQDGPFPSVAPVPVPPPGENPDTKLLAAQDTWRRAKGYPA